MRQKARSVAPYSNTLYILPLDVSVLPFNDIPPYIYSFPGNPVPNPQHVRGRPADPSEECRETLLRTLQKAGEHVLTLAENVGEAS